MSDLDYDVIVLGGGSAGSSAAAAASQAGARTAMINDGELGGLCILRGCMPTKAMLASAHALHELQHLDAFGIEFSGEARPNFQRIMARKQQQVERFKRAKIQSIERQSYELIDGRARFDSPDSVRVGDRTLRAKRYVIATGSVTKSIPIPGIDDVPVWTSDDVMRLEKQPKRLIVQGAGPIGLELAQFFARIGTEVLLVNRSLLLSRTDPACGLELTRALAREARIELAVPGTIELLKPSSNGLTASVMCADGLQEFEADALLLATGRRAALDDLGLEHVGLDASADQIAYDETMRSTHPNVYVAGDATGMFQILHLANQEGAIAGRNAADPNRNEKMDYRLRMSVIFSDPPFAQVGLGQAEALAAGHDVVIAAAKLPETGRAITMGAQHGLWRLFAERETGEILGSSILGPRADDLVHLISLLMHQRAPVSEILKLPWYHPTLSEVILNLAREIEEQRSA